jgi:hypothetical protein
MLVIRSIKNTDLLKKLFVECFEAYVGQVYKQPDISVKDAQNLAISHLISHVNKSRFLLNIEKIVFYENKSKQDSLKSNDET